MLIVGVLLAVLALAFGVIVVVDNWGGSAFDVTALGYSIGNLTLAGIFLAGVALTLIFCFGLWLASATSRMRRRNSIRRRAELRDTRTEREQLEAERDRLADDLRRERGRADRADRADTTVTRDTTVVDDDAYARGRYADEGAYPQEGGYPQERAYPAEADTRARHAADPGDAPVVERRVETEHHRG